MVDLKEAIFKEDRFFVDSAPVDLCPVGSPIILNTQSVNAPDSGCRTIEDLIMRVAPDGAEFYVRSVSNNNIKLTYRF